MLIPYTISAFIYVVILITGTITTVVFSMQFRSEQRKIFTYIQRFLCCFLLYTGACFLYMIMAYGNNQNGIFEIAMSISDIAYFLFTIYWICILQELTHSVFLHDIRIFIGVTVIYAILIESTLFMPDSVFESLPVWYIPILNGFYLLFVMTAGIYYVCKSIKMSERPLRKKPLFFSILLILYVLSDMPWLVFMGLYQKEPSSILIRFDVLIFIYFVCCILWLFRQKSLLAGFHPSTLQSSPSPECAEKTSVSLDDYGLTKREKEVCLSAAKGWSNPEIGAQLCISENTVKHHLNSCFKKIGVKNRYELIALISGNSNTNNTNVPEK